MIKSFLYSFLVFLLIGLPAAFFSQSFWMVYFDQASPKIEIINGSSRIGVGSAGGKFSILVSDQQPGLDEVVVRLRQLRSDHELFRKKLGGQKEAQLTVDVSAKDGLVGEGSGQIEIVAFDRSFYNNRGSLEAKAFVDTKPPGLEVISVQHNLRQGGTQLVIYSAHDENLAFSGVRVGEHYFQGFPAGQLDSALSREGVYAAFYTVPIVREKSAASVNPQDVRLVAVDVGGNTVEQNFYNKISRRALKLVTSSNSRLNAWISEFPAEKSAGNSAPAESSGIDSSQGRTQKVRQAAIDAATLVQGFRKINGTVVLPYGEMIQSSAKKGLQTGEYYLFTGISEARAMSAGEVRSLEALESGVYKITIDHGLALTSSYRGLKNAIVRVGQQVKAGEVLGSVDSFLAVGTEVSGQAVDPNEWWTEDWVAVHIYEKIQEAKKSLGIVVE